mmetsp:Transcript_72105/g.208852  ORF Transcript_72105/g.208852 Transcript_72105/m.208852 type:complete len:359 (-) Transcript_72105:183-1259(-)
MELGGERRPLRRRRLRVPLPILLAHLHGKKLSRPRLELKKLLEEVHAEPVGAELLDPLPTLRHGVPHLGVRPLRLQRLLPSLLLAAACGCRSRRRWPRRNLSCGFRVPAGPALVVPEMGAAVCDCQLLLFSGLPARANLQALVGAQASSQLQGMPTRDTEVLQVSIVDLGERVHVVEAADEQSLGISAQTDIVEELDDGIGFEELPRQIGLATRGKVIRRGRRGAREGVATNAGKGSAVPCVAQRLKRLRRHVGVRAMLVVLLLQGDGAASGGSRRLRPRDDELLRRRLLVLTHWRRRLRLSDGWSHSHPARSCCRGCDTGHGACRAGRRGGGPGWRSSPHRDRPRRLRGGSRRATAR